MKNFLNMIRGALLSTGCALAFIVVVVPLSFFRRLAKRRSFIYIDKNRRSYWVPRLK